MTGVIINKKVPLLISFLCFITGLSAQNVFSIRNVDSVFAVKQAESLYDEVYVGNVFLEEKAKGLKFFCDSAYKHTEEQIIEAFGNVQINRGDTLDLQSEYLRFDLNTSLAKARLNVKLEHAKATLLTDSLDYDLNNEVGSYDYGGKLIDSTSTLTSKIGRYYATTGDVFFKENVLIVGEEYNITTDSLNYNVNSNDANIIAPTYFENKDYKMYTEKGVYNTSTGISEFTQATKLINDSYVLTGDNLKYDEKSGIGILTQNCKLVDTINNRVLKSAYMRSERKDSTILAVDSIELQYIMEKDTLFAHSDTIYIHKDSLSNDVMEVYRKVKFFKTDFQGKCDSMAFNSADSVMHMFYDPTVWSGENQLTADTITAEVVNNKLKYVNLLQNALAISVENAKEEFYNQMKGRVMKGFIDNDTLHTIEVYGNGESMYFSKDKGQLMGVNQIKCSDITIRLKNQKLNSIVFREKPVGTMYPVKEIEQISLYLKGFRWDENNRPKRREDIFEWNMTPPIDDSKKHRGVITEDDEEEQTKEESKKKKQLEPKEENIEN